ncbi:MAG: primosomal protein N' [Syntrophobacteraceae bacterium]
MLAEIILFSAIRKTLHYIVPPELEGRAATGCRVMVPVGRRMQAGLIAGLSELRTDPPSDLTLRPIAAVIDESPVMPMELIQLCRWIADYYFFPLGEVIATALPSSLLIQPRARFHLTPAGRFLLGNPDAPDLLRLLAATPGLDEAQLQERPLPIKGIQRKLRDLERDGLIEASYSYEPEPIRPKILRALRLKAMPASEELQRSEAFRQVVETLQGSSKPVPLATVRKCARNADHWIKKLRVAGLLEECSIEVVRESHHAQSLPEPSPIESTPDQQRVLDALRPYVEQPAFHPCLLFGVTGSGKTEVYLQLVAEVLARGRGALVLVPEIALSTQLEAVFRQRFGKDLAICHSGLSTGARYDQWREALAGRRRVILGVRSAIFMPVRELGLIIIDEEHDPSYKQEDHLRYHARDVALVRARSLGIPILLGSATPSLQSIANAQQQRYTLLTLPNRVFDRPLPEVRLVDMRRETRRDRILSRPLREALLETVGAGEQALLFLNRRGFASFLVCTACGHVPQCIHCSVSLTFHQHTNLLQCHYCGLEASVPPECPQCEKGVLLFHGFGTERLEEEVRKLLPDKTIIRIDRDTVKHSQRLVEYFNALRTSEAHVLIGTQMIAKGHDFPGITLVGIVSGDTALQVPDYRAGETTVQLLMQVAGRAGRGEKAGLAILQTYNPSHYTIESALRLDYGAFCDRELEIRRELQYPPHTRFIRFLVTDINEDLTREAAHELAALCRDIAVRARGAGSHAAVLGPSEAPLARLNRRYRWHVFVKAWSTQALTSLTQELLRMKSGTSSLKRLQLIIDRDPVSSL